MFGAGAFRSLQSIAAPRDQRQNQPELRMRLVLPDLDMISGAFVFQSLTLHPTANPVEPSRKPDPFTITPVVRTL